jgi:hypothetical protein
MATVEELRAQRAALVAAMTSGVRVLQYEGRRTEYQSVAEMQGVIDRIDREIVAAGGGGARRRIKIRLEKGL